MYILFFTVSFNFLAINNCSAESFLRVGPMVNFGKDPDHKYNPEIMRQYVKVTENYDKHRGHDIMTVAPEFKRIQDEI